MLYAQINRFTLFFSLLALASLVIAGPDHTKPETPKTDKAQTTTAEKSGALSEEADTSAKGKPGRQRDPFFNPTRYVPPPKPVKLEKPKPPEPKPLPAAPVETRMTGYKDQLRLFLSGTGPEPSKISPYVIDELTVTGIFYNDEGIGAFLVETASRNQQTYFARAGWRTNDGYIKEILPTGVKFVKTVRFDNGTVRQVEEFRALPALNGK